MSRRIKLQPPAVCSRLQVSSKDLLETNKDDLICMLFLLHLVREFETTVLDLKDAELVHGPAHVSIGQEAVAAATAVVLRKTDRVGSTHRAHGHFLAKACMYYAPEGYRPLEQPLTPDIQQAVNKTLAEIMGLKDGWCGGRGGSMHLYDGPSGNLGSNAIVGGGIPLATGAAWAEKLRRGDNVVVSFFGDGAINQGCFHEVANMASLWEIPVIYFVENNFYAVGTATCESSSCENLGLRSLSYGIHSLIVDGMDPVAVYVAMRRVTEKMRKDSKPFLIEAETYRFHHHAGRMAGSPFGYRTREEEEEWQARDPLIVYVEALVRAKIITSEDNAALHQKARASIDEAIAFATAEKDAKRYIPPEKWPPREVLTRDVRCEKDLRADVRFVESEDFSGFKTMTYVEAIAAAIRRNMERDGRVFVLGEEVSHLRGGPYMATKGIVEAFPDRIFSTPISESGFVGMAGGAAAVGMRPVVEIMFPDFALVASDQLFNQIGKLRHMYGGQASFPMVVRTRVAIGQGYGGQHSMSPAGLFGLFSGWRVMAPSNAFDYVGLFNTAVRLDDPVLMIEHADLYAREGQVPAETMDYYVPYGKAKVIRAGSDVTVLTYLTGVQDALTAAKTLTGEGISAEVIDLRTVDYTGMDYDTIGKSVQKTGRVVIVEQTPRSMGIAGRLADEIQERYFEYLQGPVAKVAAADVPPPVSKALEEAMIPGVAAIQDRLAQVAAAQYGARPRTIPPATRVSLPVEAEGAPATPLARRLAQLKGIPLAGIPGTGPRGKIVKADVLAAPATAAGAMPLAEANGSARMPPPEGDTGATYRWVPVSSMRRTVAERLSASKFTAPHIYFFAEVAMASLLQLKDEISNQAQAGFGVRVSVNDLLIKAVALLLKEFPNLNASFEPDGLRLWKEINIGLAVALDDGLIVPAIQKADRLRFHEIAQQRADLVTRARAGKLRMEEIERGTFTISSLANYDITHFTAIINPPQSAILSVGPTLEKPVVADGQVKVGRTAVFGLAVDHRVVDGAVAAAFLTELKKTLENTGQLLLKMQ
ncbi:MAG: 2-oxo acid dehydrogenase subunit E2 [Desulfobacterales bacterium]|nr:MAG: 2-oxo acid dehydrogenase subunit E2 [Desulfobacterales bacterium]